MKLPLRFTDDIDTCSGEDSYGAVVDADGSLIASIWPRDATIPGRVFAAAPELVDVVEALLMFHAAGEPGMVEDADRWRKLTGRNEVSAAALCAFARIALAKARGKS